MTLAQLKKVVAAYLGTTTADLTRDSLDLFLVAANNVRKEAELIHSFELARVSGTLSIDGVTGGGLANVAFDSGLGTESYTVSGTLSPDLTGVYLRQGSFNGFPLYIYDPGDVSVARFLYYNAGSETYAFATTLSEGNIAFGAWLKTPDSTTAAGSYSPTGGSTGTGTVTSTTTPLYVGIKELVAIQRTNASNFLEPLDFTTSDIAIQRERDAIELCDQYGFERRYPSDRSLLWNQGDRTLVLRNNTLYIYPIPTIVSGDTLDVTIEAFAFLADYTASDLLATTERDFFLSHGHQYMQWGCICEMNYLLQKFVQRQEGVLSPPEQKKAEAWKNFLVWDSFLVVNAANRSR